MTPFHRNKIIGRIKEHSLGDPHENQREKNDEKLIQFKKKFGHCNVPVRY